MGVDVYIGQVLKTIRTDMQPGPESRLESSSISGKRWHLMG